MVSLVLNKTCPQEQLCPLLPLLPLSLFFIKFLFLCPFFFFFLKSPLSCKKASWWFFFAQALGVREGGDGGGGCGSVGQAAASCIFMPSRWGSAEWGRGGGVVG